MIHNITNLFNRAGVLVESRPAVARVIARVIFGISSYSGDRKKLVNFRSRAQSVLTDNVERAIWSWTRQVAWNWEINTCYWRALGAFIETRDLTLAAHQHNIAQEDFAYLFAQLTTEDLQEFINQQRDWRSPMIDDRTISAIIKQLKPWINNCVYRLRFVWQHDPSHDEDDWRSFFTCEALQTLYKYEDRHSLTHLVNTVRLALNNKCGIMQARYASVKLGMLVSTERFEKNNSKKVKGKKQKDNKQSTRDQSQNLSLDKSPYIARRVALTSPGEDGSEVENIELSARSVKLEPQLDTMLFIQQVEKQSEALARYLRLVAVEEEDAEFIDWLEQHELSTDSFNDLRMHAAKFLGLTRQDFAGLRRIADVDYAIGRQLEMRMVKQQQAKDKHHVTGSFRNAQPRAAVGGRHK
jgi:hypothetical protein